MKVPVAERIAFRKVREDASDPLSEPGLRGCEACETTTHDFSDRRQRIRRAGRIDPGMDFAREAARGKHKPWLLANHREEIRTLQMFHHEARTPVDDNLLVGLRYGHAC